MSTNEQQHQKQIMEQFSKQAVPFTQLPGHLSSIEMLIELSGAHPEDRALDVACGPGLVACEFARHVRHIEGIDITEAMIDEAKQQQTKTGAANISWRVGTADPLPYGDDSFSLVVTRYSFHHFLRPKKVLKEMIRVCRPGGRIVVADAIVPPEKSAAYDRMEKMRDPSHVHALTSGSMEEYFSGFGLTDCCRTEYGVEVELEAQLRASFPAPGDDGRLRRMIQADIGKNELGIHARRADESVYFSYPISVFCGRKPF